MDIPSPNDWQLKCHAIAGPESIAASKTPMPLRFLLVDELYVVRLGLRSLLAGQPDWEVCGEAADGEDAVIKAAQLGPDVVILGLMLPEMCGGEAAMEIRSVAPSAKIIFFSSVTLGGSPGEFGADAYVSKGARIGELVATIERLTARPCDADGAPIRTQ